MSFLGDLQSASFVLCGNAHEQLGDLLSAVDCYKQALLVDVFCREALDKLCSNHTLTIKDENILLASLPFKKQCSVAEEELVRSLYSLQLVHTRSNHLKPFPLCIKSLQTNADVLSDIAGFYMDIMNISACYTHTSTILKDDPYHPRGLILHLVCCVAMSLTSELFSIGHRLVNTFPNSALAWYAVSCYYFALKKHQVSRKYLCKAISLDANFASAHMAFGISLACEGERDQARAAFATAARIMQGSYIPLMFLGKEYYLTCAISTSAKFLKNALIASPNNPILLQEVGVMLFSNGEFIKAEYYLRSTVSHLQSIDPCVTLCEWEPVYNNFGHILRKLGKYDKALTMYGCALQLAPNEPTTLTSIAFTYFLNGDIDEAIEYVNHSLRFRREDQFTLELLKEAMDVASAP